MSAPFDVAALVSAKKDAVKLKLCKDNATCIDDLLQPILDHFQCGDPDELIQVETIKDAAKQSLAGELSRTIDDLVKFSIERFYLSCRKNDLPVSVIKEEPDDDDNCQILEPSPQITTLPLPATIAHSQVSSPGPIPVDSANSSTGQILEQNVAQRETFFSPASSAHFQFESFQPIPGASTEFSHHSRSHSRGHSTERGQQYKRSRGNYWQFYNPNFNSNGTFQAITPDMYPFGQQTYPAMTSTFSSRTGKVHRYTELSFNCCVNWCEVTVSNLSDLRVHQLQAHGILKYRCPLRDCKKSFDLWDPLLKHIEADHKEADRDRCCQCHYRTESLQFMMTHQFVHHQAGQFQCTKCGIAFKYPTQAMEHYKGCS